MCLSVEFSRASDLTLNPFTTGRMLIVGTEGADSIEGDWFNGQLEAFALAKEQRVDIGVWPELSEVGRFLAGTDIGNRRTQFFGY